MPASPLPASPTGPAPHGAPAPSGPARSDRRAGPGRALVLTVVLPAAVVVLAAVASTALGARPVDPATAVRALADAVAHGSLHAADMDAAAVLSRVPRTLTAALVGAALAVAGAALQGATRNPLGDPGLLGLTAGGVLALGLGVALGLAASLPAVMALAALGTLAAAALVTAVASGAARVSGVPGPPSPLALVLAGAAVTAGAGALTTALVVLNPTVRDRLRLWTVGSVARTDLADALWLTPVVLAAVALVVALGPGMDALALGSDLAHGLGARPERVRAALLAAAVALTAAAVALAGTVGFLGLVVPHAVRRLRPPDARTLVLGCALWGAALVLAADTLGRVVIAPAEVHLGVTTAVLGVPVLLALLRRRGVAA